MINITPTKDHLLLTQLNKSVQQLHAEMYPNVFKPFNKDIETRMKEMLEDPNCYAFAAEKDDKPAGYILCYTKVFPETPFQYERKILYIDQIQVNEELRNLGIGKLLLERAKELAKEQAITVLQMDHWTNNHLARNFFSNNGFSYYNERMELTLDTE